MRLHCTRVRTHRRFVFMLPVLLCLAVAATAGEAPDPDAHPRPTPEEARAFGERLELSVRRGDPAPFDEAFDVDAFFDRMFRDHGIPAAHLEAAKRGSRQSLRLGTQFVQQVRLGGRLDFLGLRTDRPAPTIQFRLIVAEGAVTYNEAALLIRDGEVSIEDVYVYASGEYMSDTIRRLLLPVLVQQDRAWLDKLLVAESAYVKHSDVIQRMAQTQTPEVAIRLYDGLPEVLRNDRGLLLLFLRAASRMGTDSPEYARALQEIRKRIPPTDPAVHLLLVDLCCTEGRFEDAHAHLAALRQALGREDAYLDFLDGNVYLAEQRYEEAEASYLAGIEREPDLQAPYGSLIDVALAREDWEGVSKRLDAVEAAFGIVLTPEIIEANDGFAGYVQSDAYRRWRAARATAAPAEAPDADAAPERDPLPAGETWD